MGARESGGPAVAKIEDTSQMTGQNGHEVGEVGNWAVRPKALAEALRQSVDRFQV